MTRLDLAAAVAVFPAAVVAARGTDLLAVACAAVVFVTAVLFLCRHVNQETTR